MEKFGYFKTTCGIPPVKINADPNVLYSPAYNDCVSYSVFEVRK